MVRIRLPDLLRLSAYENVNINRVSESWKLLRLDSVDEVGDVNQCDNVDGKLSKDRTDNVGIEDLWLRSFL